MLKPLVCVLALVAAVPATAETRLVRYDDLNLSSQAGIDRLERRINTAARQVCGAFHEPREAVDQKSATSKCMAAAKAGAMKQVAQLELRSVRG